MKTLIVKSCQDDDLPCPLYSYEYMACTHPDADENADRQTQCPLKRQPLMIRMDQNEKEE